MSLEQIQPGTQQSESPGSKNLASDKLQQDATEQTLGGKLIGAVRDIIPGLGGHSSAKASSDDNIARITADVVASVPVLGSLEGSALGGLLRASLLVDPSQGLNSNLKSFGINFAEGAALNQVSRLAMPGGKLNDLLSAKLGDGLASQSMSNFTMGAGFGGLRSGFSASTWKNKDGSFNLAKGMENVAKDSAIGGAIMVPAGFIGGKVASASSSLIANEELAPRLGTSLIGISSGFAAGSVLGGVGALTSHQGFAGALKGVAEGAVIGGATGGAMGSLTDTSALRADQSIARTAPGNTSELAKSGSEVTTGRAPAPARDSHPGVAPSGSSSDAGSEARPDVGIVGTTVRDLTYEPEPRPPLAELSKQLTNTGITSEEYDYLPDNFQGTFSTWDEYAKLLVTANRDVRNYDIADLPIKIRIPEDYAQKLDTVRQLRLEADKPNQVFDSLTPQEQEETERLAKEKDPEPLVDFFGGDVDKANEAMIKADAKAAIAAHPYGARALPEDFLPLLRELPTTTNIKYLEILDEPSPQDRFSQETYKSDYEAVASAITDRGASDDGTVQFYKPKTDDPDLRETLIHEDSHLVDSGLYPEASKIERDYYTSTYSRRDVDERWAEDRSLAFLNPDGRRFLDFAKIAPIRTMVLADEQAAQLKGEEPTEQWGASAWKIWDRIHYVEQYTVPRAMHSLVNNLQDDAPEAPYSTINLIREFGGPNQVEPLLEYGDDVYPNSKRLGTAAFDAATALHSPDPQAQLEFLRDQAQFDEPLAEVAKQRLTERGEDISTTAAEDVPAA